MTPLNQLAECLHASGDQPAFCIAEQFFTYDDLRKAIGKIQSAISKANIKTHCNIGIVANDDLETYASIFATLYSGHAFVPIHPSHPIERNQAILEQAEIKILLSSKEEKLFEDYENMQVISTSSPGADGPFIQVPLLPGQHAYLLFTSGSTGVPKGVPITINNLNAFLDSFFLLGFAIDSRDKFVQMFDLTFDLSIMSYMVPLCIGACVYTVPPEAIKYTYVYKLFEDHNITFALLVPSILAGLRKYFSEIKLPHLRYSLFCGEALYEDVTKEWAQCIPNGNIWNTYGPTEATIFCTTYNFKKDDARSSDGILSIGKAMKNTETIVVGENLQPVEQGEKGELCLGGEQVTPGYFRNELMNKKSFFNHEGSRYYRTGDLCFADNNGNLFYCGRLDYQVKINGYRVELSEIEHHAREFLNSSAIVVLAIEKEGTMQLILFAENHTAEFSELQKYLTSKVPAYMFPSKYLSVKTFPLNANGKVDRNALMKMIV